jgi:hypothetical protein
MSLKSPDLIFSVCHSLKNKNYPNQYLLIQNLSSFFVQNRSDKIKGDLEEKKPEVVHIPEPEAGLCQTHC